jgi:hypothetical protein
MSELSEDRSKLKMVGAGGLQVGLVDFERVLCCPKSAGDRYALPKLPMQVVDDPRTITDLVGGRVAAHSAWSRRATPSASASSVCESPFAKRRTRILRPTSLSTASGPLPAIIVLRERQLADQRRFSARSTAEFLGKRTTAHNHTTFVTEHTSTEEPVESKRMRLLHRSYSSEDGSLRWRYGY